MSRFHLQEHVYGNFKKPRTGKRKNSSRIKKRPGMSADHLALIRQMPCCVTLQMPGGEAHHLKSREAKAERGAAMRATDKWAIPMAHDPHMGAEAVGARQERRWFLDRGIDPHELAKALWANTGDLAKMINILMTHRGKR